MSGVLLYSNMHQSHNNFNPKIGKVLDRIKESADIIEPTTEMVKDFSARKTMLYRIHFCSNLLVEASSLCHRKITHQ